MESKIDDTKFSTDARATPSRSPICGTNAFPPPESDHAHGSISKNSHNTGGTAEEQHRNTSHLAGHYPVQVAPAVSNTSGKQDLIPRLSQLEIS